MSENKTSTFFIGLGRRMLRGTLVKETYSVLLRLTLWLGRVRMSEEFSKPRFTFLKISTLVTSPATCWAMVIRRRDAEAGADADAETQITIDCEAEGSSTDAY